MRTIRKNVFETNSSSCHTLTIVEISDDKRMLKDGILNLDNIPSINLEVNDSYIITARTYLEKLAVIIQHFLVKEEYYEVDHSELINKLLKHYNIKSYITRGYNLIYDEDDIISNSYLELIKLIDNENLIIQYTYENY